MKKQSPAIRQIIFIFVIGLVISTLVGDFNLGGLFRGTDERGLKFLFDTLSMIFAAVALIMGLVYIVYRSITGDSERKHRTGRAESNLWDDEQG